MGLATPTSKPVACPACIGNLPANLNGSIELAPFGQRVFVYAAVPGFPGEYVAPIVPPIIGMNVAYALFCSPGDQLQILIGIGLDPAFLPGNNCDLPAEGTTALGWLCKIWE